MSENVSRQHVDRFGFGATRIPRVVSQGVVRSESAFSGGTDPPDAALPKAQAIEGMFKFRANRHNGRPTDRRFAAGFCPPVVSWGSRARGLRTELNPFVRCGGSGLEAKCERVWGPLARRPSFSVQVLPGRLRNEVSCNRPRPKPLSIRSEPRMGAGSIHQEDIMKRILLVALICLPTSTLAAQPARHLQANFRTPRPP